MNRHDWLIACPYCNRPSNVWMADDGTIGHHCPACGYREVSPYQAFISWARDQRRMAEQMEQGFRSTAPDIEPLFRQGGRFYGQWTREPKSLTALPEDASERWAGGCE